jgi:hypothetical protein
MAARTGRNRDQPVSAFLDRLAGEAVVDDVVQRDATPAMDRSVKVLARAQRCDDDRYLPFGAGHQVGLEAVVRLVHDLVDRERRRRTVRVRAIMRRQFFRDAVQPFIEQRLRPRIECWKAADDPGLALGDDQFGTGHDEQRRADQRQSQTVEEGRGQGHGSRHNGVEGARKPLDRDVTERLIKVIAFPSDSGFERSSRNGTILTTVSFSRFNMSQVHRVPSVRRFVHCEFW